MISYICLCFTSLTMIISRSIHVTAHGIYSFLNELSNIPLCVCVCVSLLFGAFNPFTFKVIIHMYVLIAILFVAVSLFSSLPLLFTHKWWLSFMLRLDCFFFFVYYRCFGLQLPGGFGIAVFIYSALFNKVADLISNAFPISCICTLLMITAFDILFGYEWFPTFTVCLSLLVNLPIHNFIIFLFLVVSSST